MKKYFPWSLFLAMAIIIVVLCGLLRQARGEEDVWACYGSARYQAMSSNWPQCNEFCGKVKSYLQTHTEAEGRAKAAELHLPNWLIRKAEKCL